MNITNIMLHNICIILTATTLLLSRNDTICHGKRWTLGQLLSILCMISIDYIHFYECSLRLSYNLPVKQKRNVVKHCLFLKLSYIILYARTV